MIARFFTRLIIVGLLVCFGIFYGVDLATHGIENVHGRLETEQWPTADDERQAASDTEPDGASEDEGPFARAEIVQESTLVGSLADATGTVLQRTARGGIELIVSVFDGILH